MWDIIFGWITSKTSWIPLYILLLTLTAFKYKWKTLYVGLFIGLLFALADQTSVQLFKNVFERLRPCHNPDITSVVHIINGHCGGKFGFVSSHATNSFALAVFIGFFLRSHYRFIFPLMVFWAALVSYSRIYVGVHYPADILCGAILGTIIAIFVYYLMKYINKRFNLKIEII
jgi:undecaprenyl-diphosphatase